MTHMDATQIITMAGIAITVLAGALHVSGRISTLETKVDMLMRGVNLSIRQDNEYRKDERNGR